MRETGVEDVKVALRTANEDFTILWIVVDAETVEAKEQTLNFLRAAK